MKTSAAGRRHGRRAIHSDRSRWFHFFWPVAYFFVIEITILIDAIFFGLLTRRRFLGIKNVPHQRNLVLMSNHRSMIDSFPIGLGPFYPDAHLKPWLVPWNLAAEENFFKPGWLGWFAYHWKCIPVKAGRKDMRAIYKATHALEEGPVVIFPEGTRSRSGKLLKGRAGSGLLIMANWPTVIPVYHDGMQDVLPIGAIIPRPFRKVWVAYGKPVDLSEFKGRERTRETAQEIVDKVMDEIRRLQRAVERLKARE
jgi:1-acyl-sn-glycerol-3-phosphate acyltransferase